MQIEDLYYVTQDGKYPNSHWLKYDWDVNPDLLLFNSGEIITELNRPILFRAGKGITAEKLLKNDLLLSDGVFLFSDHIAKALFNYCPKDVQIIPSKIQLVDSSVDSFFVLNVLPEVDAINVGKSIFDEDLDTYTKVVFHHNALGNHHIARVTELPDHEFLISKNLYSIICRQPTKGLDFYKNEYSNPLYN